MEQFTKYVDERHAQIRDASLALMKALLGPGSDVESGYLTLLASRLADSYDMSLRARGMHTCFPHNVDDVGIPCYLTGDCRNPNCPYRKENT